jgi:tripartite-type tricarboxylate transporter receptor subunit TctC
MFRSALRTACAALSLAALAPAALLPAAVAQEYPGKPIRMILGYPPGSVVDIYARQYGQHLSTALKQPVTVENRIGATGTIAAEAAARAPADGYTLLFAAQSESVALAAVGMPLRFDPARDLRPVGIASMGNPLLLVNPSLGVRTMAELVAWGKRNPDRLACGAGGHATSYHFACAMVARVTGLPIRVIQYKGSPQSFVDVASGELQLAVGYTSEVETQFVANGRLVPLAALAPTRLPKFPNVPTIAEAGFPGAEITGWNGVFVPAGVPAEIVSRLNAEMVRASQQPDIAERLRNGGATAPPMSAAEFAEFVRRDRERWTRMSAETGIRAEQ